MLTDSVKKELRFVLKEVCRKNNLEHAYLAQKIGKRRHFLVGYGNEKFTQTNHVDLTDNIAFFWQAKSKVSDIKSLIKFLIIQINQLELELS